MTVSAEPRFIIHQATHLFLSEPIHIQVVMMSSSAFVWVGKEGQLGDLSIAIPPSGNRNYATGTHLLGKSVSEQSKNLACRLGK
ncbi:hypothetical protein BDB01DRAFT_796449 [Pilobolus umbonatus]|nr:hypothetical protein BDB01DRAFT_796449 [Pilobolus umbonatus]